ncbi:MAG TPA: HEAT repeat domain-containing protein [Cyclobacteriaceae bacterium]|nr:HEAT repeat domain-containing protein [Cyclobacteriaceae bacterium]
MNQEQLEHLLIDYIDGVLSPEARAAAEREIATNPAARLLHEQLRTVMGQLDMAKTLEPGSDLTRKFNQALREEINSNRPVRTLTPLLYRIAAGVALLISGVAVGYWINKNNVHEAEMAALKKEVEATKQMMFAMLDNQQSASQRMLGTTVAMNLNKPDDEIVHALVKRMNDDPNTNVRLAALDALIQFHEDPAVRHQLIESLSTQKDPAVQISLIQFLVRLKEKEVVNQLQHIVDDNRTIKAVKDEALSGILKLS